MIKIESGDLYQTDSLNAAHEKFNLSSSSVSLFYKVKGYEKWRCQVSMKYASMHTTISNVRSLFTIADNVVCSNILFI